MNTCLLNVDPVQKSAAIKFIELKNYLDLILTSVYILQQDVWGQFLSLNLQPVEAIIFDLLICIPH